jgi:hypothetical protein
VRRVQWIPGRGDDDSKMIVMAVHGEFVLMLRLVSDIGRDNVPATDTT